MAKADFITVWEQVFDTEVQPFPNQTTVLCVYRLKGTIIMVTETESVSIPTNATEWETFGTVGGV